MRTPYKPRPLGFVLIEALIALLLIGVGLLAVSKLQTMGLFSSGQSKSRTEAATLSQQKLEELRNILQRSNFTGLATGSASFTGSNATYATTWTVSTPNADLEQRLLQVTTTWTDAKGGAQRLDLNTLIAWDDPGGQANLTTNKTASLISPTGSALRGGDATGTGTTTVNADGTSTKVVEGSKKTFLLAPNGTVLLSLPPKKNSAGEDEAQSFTTITGRIMFDQNAGNNAIPNSNNVRVRLSSEGECIFNNAVNSLTAVSGGSNSYKYFTYTCYVGPGWYGNVGVTVDDSVNGSASSPTICVGDPGFNSGVSDSTLISAHPIETARRSYRGFKGSTGSYLSTGMASGSRYGLSYTAANVAATGPFDGRPRPSGYPSYYSGITAGSATDYFNQDFLVTKINNNSSCASKMTGGQFTRNAGKYVCINPDNDSATDVCPSIWPGFEGEVGTGGSINWTLTVAPVGNGTVTSSVGGSLDGLINCGSSCAASYPTGTTVTLLAAPAPGWTLSSWSGCTSVTDNACTVTVNTGTTVVPTFTAGSTPYSLSVTKTGLGSGTVTSAPSGISCGVTCSGSYAAGTSVTLTAAPDSGATFAGWGGACSGIASTCTLTLSAATSVTASFSTAPPVVYTLSVTKAGAGSGTITSSPAGISCGAACSADYSSGTTVNLTALPTAGSAFSGWSDAWCSSAGAGACSVTMGGARSLTALFAPRASCQSVFSGSAQNNNSTVTWSVTSPSALSGTCPLGGQGNSSFSCSITAPTGAAITFVETRNNGTTRSASATANCSNTTNITW